MAFKMKGSSLYGKLNLNRGGNENRPDGRAKSSAFQKDGAPMKDSPAKDRITVKRPVGTATEKGGQKYDWVDDGHVHPHDKATKRNRAERERGKTVKKVYGIKDENRDKEVAEKPGAPAIWPFKKKVKTSGAVLDRERKKKSRGKKIRTRDISKPSLSVRIFGSGKKKNKKAEPDKKRNIPGFNS